MTQLLVIFIVLKRKEKNMKYFSCFLKNKLCAWIVRVILMASFKHVVFIWSIDKAFLSGYVCFLATVSDPGSLPDSAAPTPNLYLTALIPNWSSMSDVNVYWLPVSNKTLTTQNWSSCLFMTHGLAVCNTIAVSLFTKQVAVCSLAGGVILLLFWLELLVVELVCCE